MAIRAADRVTLAVLPTPTYVRTYYRVQESTLGAPAAPTTNPPAAPWTVTEPNYTAGATTTLYTVILTVWGNGYFEYGAVQKSSAYEAAKQAYNAAVASRVLAEGLYQVIPAVTAPTTSPTGALKSGDQWWKIGPTGPTAGKFIGVAVWNGSSWQDRQMVADSVMVPGSVGAVLIEDGAMTAKLVEGDSIRTAASGQRVQLDTTGLRSFDTSNTETARIAADTGGMKLQGELRFDSYPTGTMRASVSSKGLIVSTETEGLAVWRNPASPNNYTFEIATEGALEVIASSGTTFKNHVDFEGLVTLDGYQLPTEQIVNLASATNLTLVSGTTLHESSWLRKRSDGYVYGTLAFYRAAGFTSGATFATLGTGLRPSGGDQLPGVMWGAGAPGRCHFQIGGAANGVLIVWSPPANTQYVSAKVAFYI